MLDAALNGPFGRIPLTTTALTMGRVADNQMVVSDPKSSSHHAEIRPEGQGYCIIDLGSTNGTFVNEQRLAPHVPHLLNVGDVIRIGDMRFTYEASGASGIAPTMYAEPPANLGYQATVAASPYEPPPVPQPGYQQPGYPDYQQPAQPGYPPYQPPPSPGYVPPPPPAYGAAQPAYGPAAGVPPVAPAMMPPYGMPAAQPKKSRRGLWITLGVIGGILLLSCIGFSVLVFANVPTPAKTLDTFCTDLQNGDTHGAYTQFSPGLQSQLSEATFTSAVTSDKVTSCSHGTPNQSGTSATADLTLVHASGATNNDTASLSQDNSGNWKISNVQKKQ